MRAGVRSAGGLRTLVWGSDANGRSLLRPGDDFHLSADHPRPLFHAHEAETFAAPAHRLEVESAPVVSHGQHDVVAPTLASDTVNRCAPACATPFRSDS